jgi:hypothetical protein
MSKMRGLTASLVVALTFNGTNCDNSTFSADLGDIREATTVNVTVEPKNVSVDRARWLIVELDITEGYIDEEDNDGAVKCPVLEDNVRATANGVPMKVGMRGGEAGYDKDGDVDGNDDFNNDGMGCSTPERLCKNPLFMLDLTAHPYLLKAPSIEARIEGEGGPVRVVVFNPLNPPAYLARDDGSHVVGDVRSGERLRFVVDPAAPYPLDALDEASIEIDGLEATPPLGQWQRSFSTSFSTSEPNRGITVDRAGFAFTVPAVAFAVNATVRFVSIYRDDVYTCEGVAKCTRNGSIGTSKIRSETTMQLHLLPAGNTPPEKG